MDVSIILVNYNTRELLLECIRSVMMQTKEIQYEIIVVDNGSKDNSREAVEKEFSDVTFIESGQNLGFGKANNLGAKYARGKYLFFLNTDTLLVNDGVSLFYQYAENNAITGALGSILEDKDGNSIHSYGWFTTTGGELRDCVSKYLRFLKKKELLHPLKIETPIYVEYITGADLFMPSRLFREMGGFDPDYFMYSEESDLQYRMSKRGIPRMIIPGPRIIHLEGGSDPSITKKWSFSRYYNMTSAKMLYVQKHLSPFSAFLFRSIDFVLLTPIILVSKYSFKQKKSLIKIFLIG